MRKEYVNSALHNAELILYKCGEVELSRNAKIEMAESLILLAKIALRARGQKTKRGK